MNIADVELRYSNPANGVTHIVERGWARALCGSTTRALAPETGQPCEACFARFGELAA